MSFLQEIGDLCLQSVLIAIVVVMLMIIIEYVNVKTSGKWIFIVKQKHWLQILLASFLGWIPGCVGMFAVVSLYTHRLLTFGALLAASIATFGDEAFLLFSLLPEQTLLLSLLFLALSWGIGGLADVCMGKRSAMNKEEDYHFQLHEEDTKAEEAKQEKENRAYRWLLVALSVLFACGVVFGIRGHDHMISDTLLMGMNMEHTHVESYENIAFILLALITVLLLCVANGHFIREHVINHVIKKHFVKIFVWIWIVLILLSVMQHSMSWNTLLSHSYGPYIMLLLAILIGCIPESGPHVIVIFMYINGIVPLTTLIANSIVQEGHGGLPLLAEEPKGFLRMKGIKILIALLTGIFGLLI